MLDSNKLKLKKALLVIQEYELQRRERDLTETASP